MAPASYLSTNLDNLLILSALIAKAERRSTIVVGFLVANAAVLLAAAAATAVSYVVPPSYLGFLGFVPIGLGVRTLVLAETEDEPSVSADTWSAVATLMVVNSGDTLAVFGPLFAESGSYSVAGLVAGFAIAAVGLLYVSMRATRTRAVAALTERLGPRLVPWIMIGVGIYVLADTTTDMI